VARAHDLEGTEREWVRTDRVGTRHRSPYRLCQAVRDALALVVPQGGGLRFIRWHDDGVTYWEQVATGLWGGVRHMQAVACDLPTPGSHVNVMEVALPLTTASRGTPVHGGRRVQ
jgi:hypothetical protein